MAGIVINHDLLTKESWDARRIRKRGERFVVTQKVMAEYLAMKEVVEKMHKAVQEALEAGAAVEQGELDAGVFAEDRKDSGPVIRKALVAKIGEEAVKKLVADFEPTPHKVCRIFEADIKPRPRGERLAPTEDGKPVVFPPLAVVVTKELMK